MLPGRSLISKTSLVTTSLYSITLKCISAFIMNQDLFQCAQTPRVLFRPSKAGHACVKCSSDFVIPSCHKYSVFKVRYLIHRMLNLVLSFHTAGH